MRNQWRGESNRNERGRYSGDLNNGKRGNSRLYQNRNDDYYNSERKGSYADYNDRDTNFGGDRGNNSGYSDLSMNDGWGGRRGENYGYGSQEYNDSYRNYSTQGRNSGLGNQGGYSTYGQNDQWSDDGYTTKNESEHRNDSYRKSFGNSVMNGGSWGNDRDYDESHRGEGPKGYKRSDDRITEDVNDILSDDPHIDASNIEVTVAKGEVTLNGTVSHRMEKRHAEDLVESVSGVSNVENRIRVSKDDSGDKISKGSNSNETQYEKQRNKYSNGVNV